jgi:hypothetical protein
MNDRLFLASLFEFILLRIPRADASFWKECRLYERKHQKRGAHTMIPSDFFFLLQQQRHQELVRQAKQSRLVRFSLTLQTQGMYEDAARFSYRAQRLQRVLLRRQRKFGQYLFSLVLDLLAGYGYRPGRSVLWYLLIIFGFALAYSAFGHLSLFPPDAFVYSLTSFHGRGFFPGLEHGISLHDPLVMLAAIEAVVGLLIEISFIATFTQRFFGK